LWAFRHRPHQLRFGGLRADVGVPPPSLEPAHPHPTAEQRRPARLRCPGRRGNLAEEPGCCWVGRRSLAACGITSVEPVAAGLVAGRGPFRLDLTNRAAHVLQSRAMCCWTPPRHACPRMVRPGPGGPAEELRKLVWTGQDPGPGRRRTEAGTSGPRPRGNRAMRRL
jgi:hypothetical protein